MQKCPTDDIALVALRCSSVTQFSLQRWKDARGHFETWIHLRPAAVSATESLLYSVLIPINTSSSLVHADALVSERVFLTRRIDALRGSAVATHPRRSRKPSSDKKMLVGADDKEER